MTGLFAPTENPEFNLGFVLFVLSMSDDKMPLAGNVSDESKKTKVFLCVCGL